MTKEFILTVIKTYVPDLIKIVAEPDDVVFTIQGSEMSARAFIPGTITRRALNLAYHLPEGEYSL